MISVISGAGLEVDATPPDSIDAVSGSHIDATYSGGLDVGDDWALVASSCNIVFSPAGTLADQSGEVV